ncbi:MAG: MFS transporter [Desulfobacteraceae bacterium]|nr:MAG: MFS transporter [Desulfobacteraceae bacterium]
MVALANLTAFGLINAFSVFLKPLVSDFGWSRAAAAGAYSLYAVTHNIFSPFVGAVSDKFGPRIVAASGGFCLGISMILMSRIHAIWELYVYYALFLGFGIASIYAPMLAVVSQYFRIKRGLAIGIASIGVGCGSLLMSPLTGWLVSSCNWRSAYLALGVLTWMIFIPIILLVKGVSRQSTRTENGNPLSVDFSFLEALKTKSLWVYTFSFFFISISIWPIIIHFVPLLTDSGFLLVKASLLTGLLGGVSVVGRIVGGFFSDRIGRKRILLAGFIIQMISLIWLYYSRQEWMFYVFALFFGFSSGLWAGVVAAFPADYFGLRATGSIFGVTLIMVGVGSAIGTYLGGYLFDRSGSYNNTVIMSIMGTFFAILTALFLKPPRRIGPGQHA